jgi:predicted ribosome quality control (RQC) complex YloA/Tae2 family protein
VPHPDLAEYLQARILSDLSTLKVALGAEAPAERAEPDEPCQVEALEARIAALEEAVVKAEAMAEQRREEAELASRRADQLVADLVDITSELLEVSRRDEPASGSEPETAAA